jgi:hypothetical protein
LLSFSCSSFALFLFCASVLSLSPSLLKRVVLFTSAFKNLKLHVFITRRNKKSIVITLLFGFVLYVVYYGSVWFDCGYEKSCCEL